MTRAYTLCLSAALIAASFNIARAVDLGEYRVRADDRGRFTVRRGRVPIVTTSYSGMFGRLPSGSLIYYASAGRQLAVETVEAGPGGPRMVLRNIGLNGVTMQRDLVSHSENVRLTHQINVPADVDGCIDTGFTLSSELTYGTRISYWPVGAAEPIVSTLGSGDDCLPYRENFRKMVFEADWGELTVEFVEGDGLQGYGALLNGAESTRNRSDWVQVLPLSAGVAKGKPAAVYTSICDIRFELAPGKTFLSSKRNYLYNGGFEDWANPDLPDGWRRAPYATKDTNAGMAPDETTAFDGRRSLRWTLDRGTLSHVTARSNYLAPVPIETPCVLSAYLKSRPAGVRVALRVGRYRSEIEASGDWQRHAVVAEKGTGGASLPLSIEKLTPGTLWIDAVQLEEGEQPTPFAARARSSVVGNTPFPNDLMAKDLAEIEQNRPLLAGCGPELSYYTTEKVGRLIYEVHLPSKRLANSIVSVKLRGPNGSAIEEASPSARARVIVELDVTALPVGMSRASATLKEQGKVLASVKHEVSKLPPPKRGTEVKINRLTRVLIRDGKPYLPVGSDAGNSLQRAKECIAGQAANGLNHIHVWSGFYDYERTPNGRVPKLRPDVLREILDTAHAAGMTVTVNLSHWLSINHFHQQRFTNKDLTDDMLLERSLEAVRAVREHPAVLTWHLCDEPNPAHCSPEWLERAYRAVRAEDPYHLAEINVCVSGRGMLSYLGSSDLTSIDIYPVPTAHVGLIAPHTRFMRLTGAWRPIRWWIQSWASVREPTAAEETCMTYQALVEGTRFVLFYNYRPTSYAAWSALGQIAEEVRTLTPALISEASDYGLKGDDAGRVIASRHRVGTHVYLIAVNRDTQPVDAELPVPQDCAGLRGSVLFESRQIKPRDQFLRDHFAPMERHVYRFDLAR